MRLCNHHGEERSPKSISPGTGTKCTNTAQINNGKGKQQYDDLDELLRVVSVPGDKDFGFHHDDYKVSRKKFLCKKCNKSCLLSIISPGMPLNIFAVEGLLMTDVFVNEDMCTDSLINS